MTPQELEVKLRPLPHKLQVKFALFCIKKIEHTITDMKILKTFKLVQLWFEDDRKVFPGHLKYAADAAYAAAYAAYAATNTAYTAVNTARATAYAASAASYTAYAAINAANAAVNISSAAVVQNLTLSSLFNEFRLSFTAVEQAIYDL